MTDRETFGSPPDPDSAFEKMRVIDECAGLEEDIQGMDPQERARLRSFLERLTGDDTGDERWVSIDGSSFDDS